MTFALVAGQVGCLTLVIVLIALFMGIWLDRQFSLRGPFTVGLLLLSIPISLFFMVRIALGAIKQLQPPQDQSRRQPSSSPEED